MECEAVPGNYSFSWLSLSKPTCRSFLRLWVGCPVIRARANLAYISNDDEVVDVTVERL